MSDTHLPDDPLWPRAGAWLAPITVTAPREADLVVLGVPAWRTSISPTGANATPGAVREALFRYTTYAASRGVDVSSLFAVDLGDVVDPDGPEGEQRVRDALEAASGHGLAIAIGGDNSITFPVMAGLFGTDLPECGLITLDAHHDLRDGETNGSPVRRLLEAGLPGTSIVQIGIADFVNSAAYSERARDNGITVFRREEMRCRAPAELISQALAIAGADGRPVFVDVDVDVCDRSVAPGCPAATPGGLTADELRELVFLLARGPAVRGFDITEVDATADAPDGRTVRLAALLVLEVAAGLAARP